MMDFHTHILPGVDDGSRNAEQSLQMLELMRKQGIRRIIATPHFYANDESVDSFISRRNKAFKMLKELNKDGPEIIPGAEVKFYSGISHMENLEKLRIEGSRLLLLEMPFSQWGESDIKEIIDMAGRGKFTLVLAHIERYISMQKKGVIQRLLDNGILIQSNASFFEGFFSRSKAIKMLRNNQIQFIGSDCHNLTDRAPDLGKAFSAIESKCDKAFLSEFVNYGNELFLQNISN